MHQRVVGEIRRRWSEGRDIFFILLIMFCLLYHTRVGNANLTSKSRSIAEYRPGPPHSLDSLLLVALLGGDVVAVRSESGEVLWEYNTGNPLVRVSQGEAMPRGLHMLSGVDGGLYLYNSTLLAETASDSAAAADPILERLPISLPELVETSPSLTDDGSIITGERHTRVFALDRYTGDLLHVFNDRETGGGGGGDPHLRPPGAFGGIADVPVLHMMDPDRILLVGRQDFVVRSKQMLTDLEAWNATYSRIINLRPTGLGAAYRVPGSTGDGVNGMAGALPLFTVGADHTLQAYDPTSRLRRWALSFNTPPVGVFTMAHGDTNFLDPAAVQSLRDVDRVPPPPPTVAPARGQRHRGAPDGGRTLGMGGEAGQQNLALVGELKGSLYAMPSEHVVLDERVQPQSWSGIALSGSAPDSPLPLPLPLPPSANSAAAENAVVVHSSGGGGGGSSSKDLVTYVRDGATGKGVVSGLSCRSAGLKLLAIVEAAREERQAMLPDAPKPGRLRLPGSRAAAISRGGSSSPMIFDLAKGVAPAGGDMLMGVLLAAAGVGAAAVLLVMRLRGSGRVTSAAPSAAFPSGSKASSTLTAIDVAAAATGASEDGAKSDTAAATTATATAAARSVANGGPVPGRVRGPGSGRGRRKARAGEAGSSGISGSSNVIGGSDVGSINADTGTQASQPHLTCIPEDREAYPSLSGSGTAAASPTRSSSSSAPTASHLPSAEARVQLRGDGSLIIGRLIVGPGILGYGSAGTVVYEGVLDGRPVAVKRLLRQFTELARKEIEVLILSDEHPNVVRCFALEEDREFVYLALEKCRTTLSGFLETAAGRIQFVDPDTRQPTPRCLSTLMDVCQGLAALHERGIVHRDLKPHNVLLTESGGRAKLSDMGLCKQLVPEQSSFESHHGSGGSSGWQAPEQLIARDGGAARQSRSMDVFSLGCILYYCMTGGRHPFGDNHYERDARILRGDPVLAPLAAAGSEAFNLVSSCLAREPLQRPTVGAILAHPLWWGDERRLSFLVDISDRVENEDREPDTTLLAAMEAYAGVALSGLSGSEALDGSAAASGLSAALSAALSSAAVPNWGACLPAELVANLGRYRRYDFTSLRDLLRVVRNKRNHFREMPTTLQAMLGPLPAGFLRFFVGRFPCLLLAVYVFALQHLADEPTLQQYWGDGGNGAEPVVRTFMATYGKRMRPIKVCQQQQQQQAGTALAEASAAGVASTVGVAIADGEEPARNTAAASADAVPPSISSATAAMVASASSTNAGADSQSCGVLRPNGIDDGASSSAESTSAAAAASSTTASPTPLTQTTAASLPGVLATLSAAANGPHIPLPPVPALPPQPPPLVLVGYEPAGDDGELMVREFPRRPGKQLCDFYIKTGHCKFAESCVFDHPLEHAVPLTVLGLPLRPEEHICSFYLKNNDCRFGPSCKFHHPLLRPVYAGSAVVEGTAGGSNVGNKSQGDSM
ncbi:hypothetical protein VaNZ11_007744 [Volvox africanus]|uniref:non-specific serine/threonine protein kinase n=1 Tax=Volvox africanus TaxID=51714 RepID=A0ABQ5S3N2_9CHLO|nr:hypothetical protein VaNZ11_007744 [Volvox africanus]